MYELVGYMIYKDEITLILELAEEQYEITFDINTFNVICYPTHFYPKLINKYKEKAKEIIKINEKVIQKKLDK